MQCSRELKRKRYNIEGQCHDVPERCFSNVTTLGYNVVTLQRVDFIHFYPCRVIERQRRDVLESLKIGFWKKISKLEKTPSMKFHTFPSL